MDEKNVAPKNAKPQKRPEPATKSTAEKIDPADQPFIRAEN